MGNKRKKPEELDVETTRTVLATPEALQPSNRKKQKRKKQAESKKLKHKESNQDETTALNKKIDELSNHVKELTEIVKKLEKNSEQFAISLKEKETPEKKVVECCFESKDADCKNRNSIFVRGFNCSFPKEDIRTALIKHFSSCGTVLSCFIPFHCKTGFPLGFAFMNFRDSDVKKALALNGSYLNGMKIFAVMAIKREEYFGYEKHQGCGRCRTVLSERRLKRFYQKPGILLSKQDQEKVEGIAKTLMEEIANKRN